VIKTDPPGWKKQQATATGEEVREVPTDTVTLYGHRFQLYPETNGTK
jgi:hypothetical protein